MIKRITASREDLIVGSALRHALPLFDAESLCYDPAHHARANDLLLGEVVSIPACRYNADLFVGMERVQRCAEGLVFSAEEAREGLVVIAAGNRYAPRVLLGGLRHPITGQPSEPICGGSLVSDLIAMNIAGHVHAVAIPHERPRIRVLGTLVDGSGEPCRLPRAPAAWQPSGGEEGGVGVLVAGHAMETGKTTFCMGVAAAARLHGVRCSYEKKTGSASVRDLLRVATGCYDIVSKPGNAWRGRYEELGACDFVDGTGAVSDVSMESEEFVPRSLAFGRAWQCAHPADLRVIELADNLSHRTNLLLLQQPALRRAVRHLVYVPQPSYDAVEHLWHYVRGTLQWPDAKIWLAGALATDPVWACLREEIGERLGLGFLAVPRGGVCTEAESRRLLDHLLERESCATC